MKHTIEDLFPGKVFGKVKELVNEVVTAKIEKETIRHSILAT